MEACHLASLITVQKASSNAKESLSPLFRMIDFVLSGLICSRFNDFQKFLSIFWFFIKSQLGLGNSELWEDDDGNQDSETSKLSQESCFDNKRDERNICREDVEMVMANLGLFCSSESEELKEWMDSDELSQLFDEKEPSLEEVKETFNVFDHNGDGFIEAGELQKVFHKLGLKEGLELENTKSWEYEFVEKRKSSIQFFSSGRNYSIDRCLDRTTLYPKKNLVLAVWVSGT